MRRSSGIAAHADQVLMQRRPNCRRQGPAVVGVARDATAAGVMFAELAGDLGVDRVATLGVGAAAEVGVVQATTEGEGDNA